MQLAEFLDFEAIKPSLSAGNKRSLLQQLATLAGQRLGHGGEPLEGGPVVLAARSGRGLHGQRASFSGRTAGTVGRQVVPPC